MRFVVQLRYWSKEIGIPVRMSQASPRAQASTGQPVSSRPRKRRRASLSKTTIATASMLAGWLVNPSTLFVLLTGELDICSSNELTELPNRI
jgi:hypothetical protein